MSTVIHTNGLTKHYGHVHALDGLDLNVEAGQVHGFLGPNGAGKSTTIRILLGLARATGGEATVFGEDPWRTAVPLHRRIAYVPGDVSIWPNLSGGESIDVLARLRGASKHDAGYRDEKQRLMQEFQFDPRTKGRAYSKGNRQKVALVAALAADAELLLLDEPTSGLDETEAARLGELIKSIGSDKSCAVVLVEHVVGFVMRQCHRIVVLDLGRVLAAGSPEEIQANVEVRAAYLGES
jgi:ABC-2 type transport system ATP-binding protein